jgi:hypothetical protein
MMPNPFTCMFVFKVGRGSALRPIYTGTEGALFTDAVRSVFSIGLGKGNTTTSMFRGAFFSARRPVRRPLTIERNALQWVDVSPSGKDTRTTAPALCPAPRVRRRARASGLRVEGNAILTIS